MKVLIADPISDSGISILKSAGFDVVILAESNQAEKYKAIFDADGLIIRSGTKVDSKMIDNAVRLKVIGRAGVGIDNIDLASATRKGIVVMNTPDVNTISAAEHTIALLLFIKKYSHWSFHFGRWYVGTS
jgi:D-3-phosphoglycerate dehydrogenase